MNRHLRPFGLKLGPLQVGAIYFPVHFCAVWLGLTLLIAPQGVGVFWPATGTLFAFLLLYPARYWAALLAFGFLAEILAHETFAPPQIPYTVYGLLFFVKFVAGLAGVWLMHVSIRGPISFARLHQVLGFAASAAASTLACAFVAVSLRFGLDITDQTFWLSVQSWWIGDFLGALIVTPLLLTIGFHGLTVATLARGGRLATYSAFGVLLRMPDGRVRRHVLDGCSPSVVDGFVAAAIDGRWERRFVRMLVLDTGAERNIVITPPDHGAVAPNVVRVAEAPGDAAIIDEHEWEALAEWVLGGGRLGACAISER